MEIHTLLVAAASSASAKVFCPVGKCAVDVYFIVMVATYQDLFSIIIHQHYAVVQIVCFGLPPASGPLMITLTGSSSLFSHSKTYWLMSRHHILNVAHSWLCCQAG